MQHCWFDGAWFADGNKGKEDVTPGGARFPRLSIVVLTFNRAALLENCLASLARQTCPADHFDIVVADDGSSDPTPRLVASLSRQHANIHYVRHPHSGIPATRNLGLRYARGSLIAFVADDYLLAPTYVETVIEFFHSRSEADVVRFAVVPAANDLGSCISHIYYRSSTLGRIFAPPGSVEIGTRHSLDASGAAAYRRSVFERVGPFDEALARAEDSDFAVRLRREGIAVHYHPGHEVRHHYDPFLWDTLRKCWLTGWYRCRHYRKNQLAGVSTVAALDFMRSKVRALTRGFSEARREGSTVVYLIALPFLFLFETSNKAGFACSWLREMTCALRHGKSQQP